MPSIYDLKPAFQRCLRPLVSALARHGITANAVTLAAVVLSVAVGMVIALLPERRWPLLLLPGALFARMALNAIDGMLAREYGQASRLGALLNELGDVVSDAALYLPLALLPAFQAGGMGFGATTPGLIVGIVVLATLTEMTGVLAQTIGASRRYDGPMGKSDRAFVFGTLGLVLGLGAPADPWLWPLLVLVLLLAAFTIFNRARQALLEVST